MTIQATYDTTLDHLDNAMLTKTLSTEQRQRVFQHALRRIDQDVTARDRRDRRHYLTHCPLHDVRYERCGCERLQAS